ncbi:MAG: RsmE family RNA methyltransferase [Candidatus Aphodocola sp.]
MQQYFAKNKNLELEDSDYHHIKNVMRMKKDDIIKVVFDNVVYTCKLTSISNKSSFEIINKEEKDKKDYSVDVAFSLIKEQKLNYLLQKTTELGAGMLIPINTKRSVVKIDKKKESSKIDRWQKICKEASEQSFRSNMPKINEVLNLQDLIYMDYDLKLLCSLNKNTKNIKKVIQKNNKCVKILLVVGPEGGFDPKEEEYLLNNGFVSVSLGNTVLRAETAPVVALSMINYEFMR